jgi:serine/threonine protein kinase
MNPEWGDIKELFGAALECEPSQRAAFLDEHCAGNSQLRHEVDQLIDAYEKSASFMEQSILVDAVQRIAINQTNSLLGTKLDHYHPLKQLGAGGMGEVYLAQDLKLNRKVALKLLPPLFAGDADRVRRLEQEAQTVSALNHPNIITIYEIGKVGDTHYIVTEYIDGLTLRDHAQMTLSKILDVALQIASALAAAHAEGIVHRDIKPENIMVRRDGLIKIVDFGLARYTEPETRILLDPAQLRRSATSLGVLGTIKYMSPEQAQGLAVDARSDIWSFGVVLYELLTGRAPFEGEIAHDILVAIVNEQPRSLTSYLPSVPAKLQQIVSTMLEKQRSDRYHAQELLDDLRDVKRELELANEKARLTRRSRIKSAVAIGLAALILFVGGVLWWRSLREESLKPNQINRISRLTTTGNVVAAAISPDGQLLVYVTEEAGKQKLRTRKINTRSEPDQQIFRNEEEIYLSLTFSKDGKQVYYIAKRNDGPETFLYRFSLPEGMSEKLPIRNIDSPVTFSPDGRRLAFVSREVNGEQTLKLADADGANVENLATRKYPEFFKNPAWSPDGENIACVAGSYLDGFYMTLVNVRVKDGVEKPLTDRRWWSLRDLGWRSDGRGLFLVAMDQAAGMPSYIAQVDYPGGETHKITNDLNDYRELSLISTANAFVAVQSTRTSDFWVAPVGNSARASLITHTKYDEISGMAWTPNDNIIHASRRAGENWNIWSINPDGSNRVQLTDGVGNNLDPAVSPDGRYVVFDSTRSGKTNIWRVNIDGTNLRQLTSGPSDWWPSVSLDGAWVIYSSFATGHPTLWKVSIDGGLPVQLNDRFSILPIVSPAGNLMACYLWDGNSKFDLKMAVMTIDGSDLVASFPSASDRFQAFKWTSDGQALAYIYQWEGTSNIWTRTIDGGPPRPVTEFTSDQIFDFAISRDGKQIAMARGSVTNDVVLFELQ